MSARGLVYVAPGVYEQSIITCQYFALAIICAFNNSSINISCQQQCSNFQLQNELGQVLDQ
jgi:hypothetical protein